MFLASNAAAFLRETRLVQFLDDGEIVEVTPDGAIFTRRTARRSSATRVELDWDDEGAEKGGYETFMLKEIYEQPRRRRARRSATASVTARSSSTGSGSPRRSSRTCAGSSSSRAGPRTTPASSAAT